MSKLRSALSDIGLFLMIIASALGIYAIIKLITGSVS